MLKERRRLERSDTYILTEFRPLNGSQRFSEGITSNLSRDGFNFESQDFHLPFKKGLEFNLKHPHNNLSFSAQGTVVWKKDGWYKCTRGIQFTVLDEEAELTIDAMLSGHKNISVVSLHKDNEENNVLHSDQGSMPGTVHPLSTSRLAHNTEKPADPLSGESDAADTADDSVTAGDRGRSLDTVCDRISDLIQHEDNVAERKQWYHAFSNLFPDSMLLVEAAPDSVPVIIDANESACTMHGYTIDELIGKPITLLEDQVSHTYSPDTVHSLMRGERLSFETRHMNKKGMLFPVAESAAVINFAGTSYIVVIDKDITDREQQDDILDELSEEYNEMSRKLQTEICERQNLEESMKSIDTRYKELFDSIQSGAVVLESAGNGRHFIIRDINRSGEWLDNINRDNVIGKRIPDVIPGIKETGLLSVFKRVWKTGKPEHHRSLHHNGSLHICWRNTFVYKLPTGEITALYSDTVDRIGTDEHNDLEDTDIRNTGVKQGGFVKEREAPDAAPLPLNSRNGQKHDFIPVIAVLTGIALTAVLISTDTFWKSHRPTGPQDKSSKQYLSLFNNGHRDGQALDNLSKPFYKQASLDISRIKLPKPKPERIIAPEKKIVLQKNPVKKTRPEPGIRQQRPIEVIAKSRKDNFKVYEEPFDNNKNNWHIFDVSHASALIEKSAYQIDNKTGTNPLFILHYHDFPHDNNFIIEAFITTVKRSDSYSYGLLLGAKDAQNSYAFQIGSHNTYSIKTFSNGIEKILAHGKTRAGIVHRDTVNSLKIIKQGRAVSFYINDVYLDKVANADFYGRKVGFIVEGVAKIAVEKEHSRIEEQTSLAGK